MSPVPADVALALESAAGVRNLAPELEDRMLAVIVHDLAHGLDARESPPAVQARALARYFGAGGAAPGARVWAGGGGAGLMGAVFANSTLLAASLQEDFWGSLHLGPVLIPPVLALAETGEGEPARTLTALAGGYQVALTAAALWGRAAGARGLRSTPLLGQLGAAVACGLMLGLDELGLQAAVAHAAATASGTAHGLLAGTAEWQFEAGHAAAEGLRAALLARMGAEASPDALEGPAGFAAAFAGVAEPASQPGGPPSLLEVGLKRHPVNVHVMSAVEAALAVVGTEPLPGPVRHVLLELPADEASAVSRSGPFQRPMQAVLSAPACVALSLLQGEFSLRSLQAPAPPAAAALAKKVEVRGHRGIPALSARLAVAGDGWERSADALDPVTLYRPTFAAECDRLESRPPSGVGAPEMAALTAAVAVLPDDSAILMRLLGEL